ncbi:hypothetical protein PR048_015306, partial [Dryococelus australis]
MYQKKILRAKKTSDSNGFPKQKSFLIQEIYEEYKRLAVKLKDYVTCVCDSQWWLGTVEDISADQSEYFVMFFHPAGMNTSFKLTSSDKVWIKENHIFVSLVEFSLATTGRCHNINTKLSEEFRLLLFKHLR